MTHLNNLSREKQFEIVFSNKDLKNALQEFVYWSEIEGYADDKLRCFEYDAIDYELNIHGPYYMRVKDAGATLNGMIESVKCFGGSERLEKALKKAEKLRDTNLWEYTVAECLQIYLEDEIKPSFEWVGDVRYAITCGDVAEFKEKGAEDLFDCFVENGYLDDYLENDGRIYKAVA